MPCQNDEAEARLERLEALKNGKAPVQDQTVELGSVETRMGKKTIELHHISKSYGEKKILEDFSYIVLKISASASSVRTDAENPL